MVRRQLVLDWEAKIAQLLPGAAAGWRRAGSWPGTAAAT